MEFLDYKFNKNSLWTYPNYNDMPLIEKATLFLVLKNLMDIFASVRQMNVITETYKVPSEANDLIDEDTFDNARIYQLECEDFRICKALYRILITFLEIHLKLPSRIWFRCVECILKLKPDENNSMVLKHELLASCLFASSMIIAHFLAKLPLKVYQTYVLEKHYNFTKESIGTFVKDSLISITLAHIVIIPTIMGIVLISRSSKGQYFVLLWFFLATMFSIWYFVLPPIVAYFYDFTPLDDPFLRESIGELVEKVGFPMDSVYVADSSKRTSHSNAFIFGFGKTKKIVLFNTLFKNTHEHNSKNEALSTIQSKGLKNDEVLAVVAHELGHWHYSHVFVNLLLMQINLVFMLNIYYNWYGSSYLYESFGFPKSRRPVVPGIYLVYFYILIPYHAFMSVLDNFFSRVMENQADEFATELVSVSALKSGLVKIYKDNLDFPLRDWVYNLWYCTHPSQMERIRRILDFEKQKSS